MPKIIPTGGKREFQVKVNLNKPEYENLEKLAKFYNSDKSSTLRRLFLERENFEKYVISLDEIITKLKDICKNNSKNLTSEILNDFNSLIKISEFLTNESSNDDKFNKRKLLDETPLKEDLLSAFRRFNDEQQYSKELKIVIINDINDGQKVIDFLQKGKCVICDYSYLNLNENEISKEFNFLLGGIYGIKAKTIELVKGVYIFTPKNMVLQNLTKNN